MSPCSCHKEWLFQSIGNVFHPGSCSPALPLLRSPGLAAGEGRGILFLNVLVKSLDSIEMQNPVWSSLEIDCANRLTHCWRHEE